MSNKLHKLLTVLWRAKSISATAERYYNGVVHNCARVSSSNRTLAFAVHHKGIFRGPVIEQIARPETVQLSEQDDCVIVKDGYVYELTKRVE